MKTIKAILIILLIGTSSIIKAQLSNEFLSYIIIEDSIGTRDSVIIGHDYDATFGIDTAFGEEDISAIEYDSLEIRSIHRTSDSVDCIFSNTYPSDPFPGNYDLKKDIRKSGDEYKNRVFCFRINAKHYPVKVYSDFSQMFLNSLYNGWTQISSINFNCSHDNVSECNYIKNYLLFVISDSTYPYILIYLDFDTGIKSYQNNEIHIFPNPAKEILNIRSEKPISGIIKIYGLQGNAVLTKEIEYLDVININLQEIPSGVYFIEIINDQSPNYRNSFIKL